MSENSKGNKDIDFTKSGASDSELSFLSDNESYDDIDVSSINAKKSKLKKATVNLSNVSTSEKVESKKKDFDKIPSFKAKSEKKVEIEKEPIKSKIIYPKNYKKSKAKTNILPADLELPPLEDETKKKKPTPKREVEKLTEEEKALIEENKKREKFVNDRTKSLARELARNIDMEAAKELTNISKKQKEKFIEGNMELTSRENMSKEEKKELMSALDEIDSSPDVSDANSAFVMKWMQNRKKHL